MGRICMSAMSPRTAAVATNTEGAVLRLKLNLEFGTFGVRYVSIFNCSGGVLEGLEACVGSSKRPRRSYSVERVGLPVVDCSIGSYKSITQL